MARIDGTSGDDTLEGQSSGDSIFGADGNDLLTSVGSSTTIFGGNGNDTIVGDGSSNILRGEAGNDVITGGGSSNTLYGGAGDDDLTAGGSSNILYGEAGDDTLDSGDNGSVTLNGADGDDVYQVTVSNASNSNQFTTFIDDSGGDDILDLTGLVDSGSQLSFAGSYDLYIYVDDANGNRIGTITLDDHFYSATGIETLVIGEQSYSLSNASVRTLTSRITYGATDGNDTINGGSGRDTIDGLGGDDVIVASEGQYSRAYGGNGDDDITANGDGQSLYGENGDDTLSSGDNDRISLRGSSGDDRYEVEWSSASQDENYYTYIHESNFSLDGGSDVLDLSAIAGSIDNVSFAGEWRDLTIFINDDDGNRIGSILVDEQYNTAYDSQIETLIIGDDTIDLSAVGNADELNSIVKYGASENGDLISVAGDNETAFGFGGNDTIFGGGTGNELSGGDGDDVLTSGGTSNRLLGGNGDDTLSTGDNDSVFLSGNSGDDRYVVDWTSATTADNFSANIGENTARFEGSEDVLDLTAVAGSLENLAFSGSFDDLVIVINDDEGNRIGTVTIRDQYETFYERQIETLIVGDDTLDLGGFSNGDELNSLVTYGASENNDLIIIGGDRETVYGYAGDDTITGGGVYNYLYGGAGNDVLTAGGSENRIYSGTGNDTLSTGGHDYAFMYGGQGDNTYLVDWSNTTGSSYRYTYLEDGPSGTGGGEDVLDLSAIASSLNNLTFEGAWHGLTIYVNDDNGSRIGSVYVSGQYSSPADRQIETLIVGNETLDLTSVSEGSALNSVVQYGVSRNDDLINVEGDNETVFGIAGDDTIIGGGTSNNLYGGDGNDDLTAGGRFNYLYGGDGDDTLSTNDNDDVYLYGQLGDDTYVVDWSSASESNPFYTRINENASSSNGGTDVLDLSAVADSLDDLTFAGTSWDLTIHIRDDDGDRIGTIFIGDQYATWYDSEIETLIVGDDTLDLTEFDTGNELNSVIKYGASANDDLIAVQGDDETVFGFVGDDTITGGGTNNYLYGDEDNDVLNAGGRFNHLYGEEGDDTLNSANHDDVYLYGGIGDDFYNIEWSGASASDPFYSLIRDNSTSSSGGDDILDLSSVAESIENLSFVGTSWDLTIYVNDDEGNRIGTVFIDDQYATWYDSDIETLVIGDDTIDLTDFTSGAELNSVLKYNAGDNNDLIEVDGPSETVFGYEGDDTIRGGGSDNWLYGGGGNDNLTAGGTSNRLFGDAGNDVLTATADDGSTVLYGGVGDDTLISGVYFGNLYGEDGADTLETSSTYLWMYGGSGDDTYVISWTATSDNFARINDTNYTTSSGSDILDLSNVADSFENIRFATVSSYDLYVYVDDGNGNTIGTIILDDQFWTGRDERIETLRIGEQTFDLSTATSTTDLNAALASRIGDTAENISGTTSADVMYGYGGDDLMNGGAGNDKITGDRGADTLYGGEGNDTLVGGTQSDMLDGGNGADSLLGGNGNDTVKGGSGTDTLSGSLGDDSLHGGGGGDRLFGDAGADTLNGGGGGDRIDYLRDTADLLIDLETGEVSGGFAEGDVLIGIESVFGGKGDDTLRALEAGSRLNGAGGDDLIVGRGGNDLLAGGNDNDTILGGAGNDLMNGNRGDDTLIGGAGDDTMRGSAGSDTFVFAAGSDDDEIVDFRSNDLLDLTATVTDFDTLDDVLAAATETTDGLLIDLGDGDSVLLAGASLSSLTEDNLLL